MNRTEFLAACEILQPDSKGCRLWPHRVDQYGYPEIWLTEIEGPKHPRENHRFVEKVGLPSHKAAGHRVMLEIMLGRPIKEGHGALHTCDVRRCIEQTHLYEGTAQQNVEDAIKRGRRRYASGPNPLKGNRGSGNGMRKYPERNAKSKLNPEKVREIRELIAAGSSTRAVAQRYEVAVDTIRDMLSGRTWRYVK